MTRSTSTVLPQSLEWALAVAWGWAKRSVRGIAATSASN
jgi:hypothetical protein